MAWQLPKVDWQSTNGVGVVDMQRIEENIAVLRQASGIQVQDAGGYFTATELEAVLQELGADLVTSKAALVTALGLLNQSATTSDSIAVLAQKVSQISTDATAAVGEVLNTKTFYQGGAKKTGTMPNHTTNQAAIGMTPVDGRLYLLGPAGYYNGTTPYVYKDDADFLDSNIKLGVELFGKTGTYVQYAAGSISITSASSTYTVNGLAKQPTAVIVRMYKSITSTFYEYLWTYQIGLGNTFDKIQVNSVYNAGDATPTNTSTTTQSTPYISITSNSFTITASALNNTTWNGGTLYWQVIY